MQRLATAQGSRVAKNVVYARTGGHPLPCVMQLAGRSGAFPLRGDGRAEQVTKIVSAGAVGGVPGGRETMLRKTHPCKGFRQKGSFPYGDGQQKRSSWPAESDR
jgi:hypothetical protein